MTDTRKHQQLAAMVRSVRRALEALAADLERIERDLEDSRATVKGRPGEDGATVGQRVAHTRVARGLSQRDLARRAGMTASQLSKIEHNMNDLSSRVARRIADALEVPVAWLLCGNGERKQSKETR